jgi:hypothetical protein
MDKEERKAYMKKYYTKNKKKFLEYNEKFYQDNPYKKKIYNRKHYIKKHGVYEPLPHEHRKAYMRKYMKEYNEQYPHIQRSKRLLNDVLRRFKKKKTNSTSKLLGYTALDLKKHLDKLGMNWDIHQIDHKIPVSLFDKNTPMFIINDLRNLQPLTKEENLEKSDKYCTLVDENI